MILSLYPPQLMKPYREKEGLFILCDSKSILHSSQNMHIWLFKSLCINGGAGSFNLSDQKDRKGEIIIWKLRPI